MKVKDLIEVLSKFDQELEVCECGWSDQDIDYVYFKYNDLPVKIPSKKFNKLWDKQYHIKEKHFVCL
jgi:hypothetical protein